MSNNPFSKFVVDPSKVPNPNTITAAEFEKYTSNEITRLNSSFRVYKRSAVYLAGCIGLMLVTGYFAGKSGRTHLLGSDSKNPP
jgi:hypothetical protein